MLIKSQRLTLFSPLLSKTRRIPVNSHQTLVAESVITRRTLGAITATPSFHKNPVVIRRRIKLERVTRNCVRIDREIDEEEEEEEKERGDLVKQSIWEQMKEIVKFTGPAMGMWICGPLMSLIDTVVIGQGSSIELAALGTLFNHTCLSGLVANFEPVDWSPTQ